MKKTKPSEEVVIVEEELNLVDIDDLGNLENLPRFVFIDEECSLRTLRSLIDVPPPPLLIKFQKKFQPGHLKICSSKQTSSILLLKFLSTDFQPIFNTRSATF